MLKFTLKLLAALTIAGPCAAATFTVTSNADTAGASCAASCTLRQAITAANATGASDTINFNVAGGGEVLIQPATPLPLIIQPLIIDGYTQGNASVNTAVSGSNAQLRVRLHGAAIATTAIAGFNACASTVSIRGFSITGFTTTGSAAIRSGGGGCATATQVSVLGNFIGLRADGITADANFSGVEANGAIVHVGSANLADRNVIGSTTQAAILIVNTGASGSSASNNLIGSSRLGDAARPVGRGIVLGLTVGNVSIGTLAAPNVIANVADGVGVFVVNGSNNLATANRFHGLSMPVDLSVAAVGTVTANDLDDIDTGPNGLQNFPVIQSVQRITGGVRVQGTLDVPAASNNAPYTLSFYANTACAASGNGPGERFLGNFPANFTQGSGESFSIDVLTQDLLPTGTVLTAAATGPEGSSEFSACAALPAGTAGFVVTTTGAATGSSCGGACTLIQAINAANARAGTDTVAFHLPGSGAHLIGVNSLPALKSDLILDGYTQPGAAVNTDSLRSNAQIKIELYTDVPAGGLFTCGSNITVRGLALTGLQVFVTKFDPVTFSCSVFGTNVRFLGNFVGIKPDGSIEPVPSPGVLINDTVAIIGTAAPADRNVLGPASAGVALSGAVAGTLIQGNLIGTDPTGLLNRGNTFGIQLGSGVAGVHAGGSGPQANLIAFNSVGIVAFSSAGSGNRLFGNHFQANTALGIDLSTQPSQGDGITANDLNDADTGANLLQNFPVLSAASQIGNTLRIQGQLDVPVATSNASYTLAFYESASCDASGNGEGEIFLGTQPVTLSGAAESFSVTLPIAPNPQALQITATATDPNGNTSEFSACRLATALPEIIFQSRFE